MTAAPAAHGPALARNAVLQFLGQAFPLGLGLLTIPLVVRGLGPDRFGLLSLAWALIGYFAIFDLGLGRAATKVTAEVLAVGREADVVPVLWSAVTVQAALGVAGGLVLAGLAPVLTEHVMKMPPALVPEARVGLFLLAASVPVFLVMGSLRGMLEAAQRFDLLNLIRGPFLVSYFLMPLLGVLLHFDLRGIIALLVLSAVATLVAYGWACVRVIPALKTTPRVHGPELRRLLRFGGWVSVTAVLGPILVQLDRFIVAAMLSVAAVGYYAAPYEMVTRLWIVPSSLTATLFPAFSALSVDRGDPRLPALLRRSSRLLLLSVGPLVAVLIPFAGDVVRLMFGAGYVAPSTPVFQILAVGVLVNCLAFVPVALIQAVGRPDLSAKIHLIEVPIHVLLVWVLVSRLGIVGAALAWSIRVLLDLVLQYRAAARLTALPAGWFVADRLPQAVLFLAVAGGGGWALAMFTAGTAARLALMAALLALVAGAVWGLLLDGGERRSLLRIIRAESPAS